jgi:hypothetical protein
VAALGKSGNHPDGAKNQISPASAIVSGLIPGNDKVCAFAEAGLFFERQDMQRAHTPAGARPMEEYIAAMQADILLLARIEQTADLAPGSILDAHMQGVENAYSDNCPASAWARWIGDGYEHDDGSTYTPAEIADLRERLAPIFAEQ